MEGCASAIFWSNRCQPKGACLVGSPLEDGQLQTRINSNVGKALYSSSGLWCVLQRGVQVACACFSQPHQLGMLQGCSQLGLV